MRSKQPALAGCYCRRLALRFGAAITALVITAPQLIDLATVVTKLPLGNKLKTQALIETMRPGIAGQRIDDNGMNIRPGKAAA